MPREQRSRHRVLIDSLTADDALAVLGELSRAGGKIGEAVNVAITEYLQAVDSDEIAWDVFDTLDAIAVEDVWDRSGRTRDGYTEPAQAAVDVFEEALEPFVAKLKEYLKLEMYAQADEYCLGVLRGIYDFDHDSVSEYKEWAEDVPGESFAWVRKIWMDGRRDLQAHERMDARIATSCPKWT